MGLDLVYLNDSDGAIIGGIKWGHSAVIVGDDSSGWTYYSKDGGNDPSNNIRGQFATLADFMRSEKSKRYDRGLYFSTSQDQDMKMKDFGDSRYKDAFGNWNDCADLAGGVLTAGGIPASHYGYNVFPVNDGGGLQSLIPTTPNEQFGMLEGNGKGVNINLGPPKKGRKYY